jgi:hypothetical protein
MSILGLIVMFADDGTPIGVVDKDEYEAEKAKGPAVKETPDGEKVEDFLELDEEEVDEDEWFDIEDEWDDDEPEDFDAAFINTEKRVKALDEMVRTNQETGQYDIGINPLVKDNDEVQPERQDSDEAN